MSHITEIKLEIKDLDALEKAVQQLGGELRRDQKGFIWYGGRISQCDATIHFNNARYEIGVIERGDRNGYTLKCDWFDSSLRDICGMEGFKLSQEYAAAVTWNHYESLGYTDISRSVDENGEIVLEAR